MEDSAKVVLEEWPIVSISSITLRGDAVVEDDDFFLRTREGVLTFFTGDSWKHREYGPLVVSYVAGYEAAPDRVKTCCLRLGSYWFSRRESEGVGAQLLGDFQETFRIPEARRIMEDELTEFKLDAVGIIN